MDIYAAADHIEIQQVLYRYCRAVDRGDEALLSSVYHPGAVDRHGAYQGTGEAFAAMLVSSMDRAPRVGQHHITNVLIELDGDAADVESYFLALHPLGDSSSGEASHVPVTGRYLDRFERRDGAWKIADRTVVLDWSTAPVACSPWAAQDDYPQGGRRQEDPSYGPRPQVL
jgi:hypothetical protein